MCNRFLLTVGSDAEKVLDLVELCNKSLNEDQRISAENLHSITPGSLSPALMVANQKTAAVFMEWGFESGVNRLVINARGETAAERPMFKGLIAHQRCALPASGYYEWRDGDNLRHLITRKDGQSLYLAGLYRSDDRGRLHFVVLTRAAYGPHAKIHSRMPCLLYTREEARRWIHGVTPLESLCKGEPDALDIEVQGLDQLMMDFDD